MLEPVEDDQVELLQLGVEQLVDRGEGDQRSSSLIGVASCLLSTVMVKWMID